MTNVKREMRGNLAYIEECSWEKKMQETRLVKYRMQGRIKWKKRYRDTLNKSASFQIQAEEYWIWYMNHEIMDLDKVNIFLKDLQKNRPTSLTPVAKSRICSGIMLRRRQWHPTPVLLPGKSHGQRSLVGGSPWGRWGSDMTEWPHFHFSPSCIGEGNGNPLQCSCLENPRDGGAWWAAVYGVAQSWTQLKWLSSSNITWISMS